MNCLRSVTGELTYQSIIGTGGIGTGMVFLLEGNHTLGRNESRLATLLPSKDYCKLHIITHYIAVMLSQNSGGDTSVYAIGKVGDDEVGNRLLLEMRNAGILIDFIEKVSNCNTLQSVCFLYPDSAGGNITTLESACAKVTSDDVSCALHTLTGVEHKREVFLAVPEVPLAARLRLLEEGKKRGGYTVSTVLSGEVDEYRDRGGFTHTDLLAINVDEARAIVHMTDESISTDIVIRRCIRELSELNAQLSIVITDGKNGSYGYQSDYLEFIPPLLTKVASTAGAGDAFLSGLVIGLCCGLPLLKGGQDSYFSETPVNSSIELGTLLASMSVTSMDTIHHGIDASSLLKYAREQGVVLSDQFLGMWGDQNTKIHVDVD